MATHVYANGLEIASKSADGVAPAAFPDPCWSPPPPPAGPIVIPYANFTRAPKIRKGTRSVFIKGKTVAIEDKSYFVNSTGNEPATYAFARGVVTHALKGKAYFRSWSMNVKFEGRGVARHMDLVSHNHGSNPSNTLPFYYLSEGARKQGICEDDEKRVDEKCKPEKNGEHWTKTHCSGLEGEKLTSRKRQRITPKILSPTQIILRGSWGNLIKPNHPT